MNAKATQVLEVNFIQGADYTGEAKKAAEEATLSATHAYNSEVKAKASELAAAQSEAKAKTSENNAKASETAAKTSENKAKASEEAAKASEENAAQSETAADTYQQQAAIYAATAFGASAPAWNSTTVYNYPQVVAYTNGKAYRCIGTNVVGEVPTSSNNWVAITLDTDDFWDIDSNGDYMPSVSPTYSASWAIDGNGDLEPKPAN